MTKIHLNFAYVLATAKERERLARRYDRLNRTEQYLEKAATSLHKVGNRRLTGVRVRRHFVHRPDPPTVEVSDRALPPPDQRPPATRLLKSGLALRFYLIALCAAQMRTRRGQPGNELPLLPEAGGVGWVDLVAVPAEPEMSGRYAASRASKKQRQIQSALKTLSSPGVQLVHLPNRNKRYKTYEGFRLLDEGGVRALGDPVPYVIPPKDAKTFALPTGLFSNGWIHLLEDAELAFLMMLAEATAPDRQGEWVKITSEERLLHYGIGRDAYAAHKTLSAFGLVKVHADEGRHGDGKVMDYNKGAQPQLHALKLEPDGFEEPAFDVMKDYLEPFKNRPAS
ncbi:hypothetical protein [Actinomadura violacea]|uniref:Uncharacterized protein n=1 Tax=Actinomadura violacea TaxID=2819934 RepID=A0ABS3RT61_9ACTN|nr:hypothetical protein [Actinomadura violacea]MBO2459857.1 hypothetical protein [Actinomadura violacea]